MVISAAHQCVPSDGSGHRERHNLVVVDDFEDLALLHETADVGQIGRETPGFDHGFLGNVDHPSLVARSSRRILESPMAQAIGLF